MSLPPRSDELPPNILIEKLTDVEFSKYFKDWMLAELHGEGFPNWMIYSFVSTAKETKTVVLSRTPGGVGTDLINASYDLKGFQIKAKSCNWGPMAGFICQLPFLNKAGAEKISYNTGYIFHYLQCLKEFSGVQPQLDAINKNFADALNFLNNVTAERVQNKVDEVWQNLVAEFKADDLVHDFSYVSPANKIHDILTTSGGVWETQMKDVKAVINTEFYKQIGSVVKQYRDAEQKSGEWSGENSIEGADPFIPLKRKFNGTDNIIADTDDQVVGVLKSMEGVNAESVQKLEAGKIYGFASDTEQSVFVEFLLKKEEDELWAIYHGQLFHKVDDKPQEYRVENNSPYWDILDSETQKKFSISVSDKVTLDHAKENKEILDKIFSFSEGTIDVTVNSATGLFKASSRKFYPLRGFVNPHPPYKKEKPNPDETIGTPVNNPYYYKNAVSGDYDLFAFWPHDKIRWQDLKRKSEEKLNANLKVFTNPDVTFCIEMIPGFSEINANALTGEELKESVELGNISTCGATVAGTLNSFSNQFLKPLFKRSALNKAFHSDEGGRPGILEIEFPIAVFFPKAISTPIMNNKYVGGGKAIPPFAKREPIDSYGGLIKTPEELLNLMGIMQTRADAIILMQADWMSHLFYISLPQSKRLAFLNKSSPFADMFSGAKGLNNTNEKGEVISDETVRDKRANAINKKLKEFKAIEANHAKIFPDPSTFDQPDFEKKLQFLLNLKDDKVRFEQLRYKFLEMAFNANRKAADRKSDIEQFLHSEWINPQPGV